jgi:hydroxymethylbilane synthase
MGRLQKEKEWWGVILACAGIDRLGGCPEGLVMERLSSDWMVPAPGQGALAIECREDDLNLRKILEKINCADVQVCVEAEKAFLREWGGGCSESLGAYAQLIGRDDLTLRVAVKGKSGQVVRGGTEGSIAKAASMGSKLAEKVRNE